MKKSEYFILAVILGLSAVLGLLLLTKGQDWGDDFAAYIMQAQSIVKGNEQSFIERNAFTINSTDFILGPVAYPWGYPLILASVYAVTGLNLIALKLPVLVFFIAFLFVLFRFYRRRLSSIESCSWWEYLPFIPNFWVSLMKSFRMCLIFSSPFLRCWSWTLTLRTGIRMEKTSAIIYFRPLSARLSSLLPSCGPLA